MTELVETRDAEAKQIQKAAEDVRLTFESLTSINDKLGEDGNTVEVFQQLDKDSPEIARVVYDYAEPALVQAKKYSLCGKYLVPKESLRKNLKYYNLDLEFAAVGDAEHKQFNLDLAERHFLDRTATTIALLVLNERNPEAEEIATVVRQTSKHPNREAVLDAALKGKVPALRQDWQDRPKNTR